MNNYYLKKFLSILKYSIIFYFLFIFAKYVNRDIHIDALYMDDLFSWSYFGEGETFLEYSFPTSGHTYRPVYWMIQYLEFFFVKDNINLFLYINLLLNSFISLIIYHIVYKISKSNISGIISSLLYISSYFSYYQIAQVIGTLESIALLFAILVLYNLILFIKKEEKYINNFLISNFFFLLVIFTHERYIGLIIPIILAFLLKIYLIKIKKKEYLSLILPIFSIILFVYIRTIILGNFIPRGTGSKEVTTTFDLMNCLHFAIDQVKYIFAFNPGEAYLSAINFNDLNYDIKVLIYKSLIPILISIILYIILKTFFIIKNNNKNIFKYILKHFSIDIIIISFIAMCIASSSATIRVEMRWVYISYVASIVYLSFIISEINFLFHNIFLNKYNIKNEKKNYYIKKAQSIVFTIFIFASFFGYKYNIDIEYRKNYPNIYFFEDQTRMNNLANMTINKYGKDNFIGKKNVYILYNIYDMSEFYASWFYRPFKYKWNGDGTRIYLINSLNEIEVDKRNDNSIILVEDLLNKSYNEFEVTKEMWEMLDDSK